MVLWLSQPQALSNPAADMLCLRISELQHHGEGPRSLYTVLFEPRRQAAAPDLEDGEEDGAAVENFGGRGEFAATLGERRAAFGFGRCLKRSLETNEAGMPVLEKRKRRKVALRKPVPARKVSNDSKMESLVDKDLAQAMKMNGMASTTRDPLSPTPSLI